MFSFLKKTEPKPNQSNSTPKLCINCKFFFRDHSKAFPLRCKHPNVYVKPNLVTGRPDVMNLCDENRKNMDRLDKEWGHNRCGENADWFEPKEF